MNYSAAVRRHFHEPSNAGAMAGAEVGRVRGEAGSAAAGTWVVFWARIEGQRLVALRFQALACPHVIAACSRATELLAGLALPAARAFDPKPLMAELQIPPDKLGRLLIMEDALRNCFAAWDTTQLAGA